MADVVVDYPWDAAPAHGEAIEVAPGILWVQMPLPFALNHVNLYLLDDGDGWTLIDCGINRDQVKEIWEQVFAKYLGGKPIRRVLVTHFHPDHMGLCQWLTQRFDAELMMSRTEWLSSHYAFGGREQNMELMLDFWRRYGMSTEVIDGMRGRGNFYQQSVGRPPAIYRRLKAGDEVTIGGREWTVIIGEGHAPEHVCLACDSESLLIAGDQILPRITTNVSVQYGEPEGDPLQVFLDSRDRFRHLRADTLTLCAHDRPFRNLHARLDQLGDHHNERLDAACEACTEPKTAVELFTILFKRELNLHQQSFAIGEAIAHMHRLMYAGRLNRIEVDGVYRFVQP